MEKEEKISYLEGKAKDLRKMALTMIYTAQSGHPGGSFSAADIVAALYFSELSIDPRNPRWEERDRFVLSKGHVCPIQYAALIMRGFMEDKELYTLRKKGTLLQGHPDMKRTPGIDISTGSLGQGVACAVGMAIGLKRDGKNSRVFVVTGDGESDEGQVWEAMMTASKYALDNLIVFVDNNGLQNDGYCDDIMPTRDLAEKYRAFGCEVHQIDGHNMEEIVSVLDEIRGVRNGKPIVIVAKTIKGKGVSFMENVVKWHGVAPDESEYKQAMEELERGFMG